MNTASAESDIDWFYSCPWSVEFTKGTVHWRLRPHPTPEFINGEPYVREVWAGENVEIEEEKEEEEASDWD